MQVLEQELQEKLIKYDDFVMISDETEQETEEYQSPSDVIKHTVLRLESLFRRMQAYSSLLSAVSDAIVHSGNDVKNYVKAIEYLDDKMLDFLNDLETLFEETDKEKKNL